MTKLAIILTLGLFAAEPAHADWGYVKWGMNQKSLIAASKGTARAIDKSDFAYGRAIASAVYSEGAWTFDVQFSGSTSAQAMFGIPIEIDNIRFGTTKDCEKLLPYLQSKYPMISTENDSDYRFSDGADELRYHPFYSTRSFRRFKRGEY